MMKLPLRKTASLACLLLILTSVLASLSVLPEVRATVALTLTPATGDVGSTMELTGNLTTGNSTLNGTFNVFWDNSVLLSNSSAVGNSVDVLLTVPPGTAGNHNVTLNDIATGENATTSFTVLTAYSLNVSQKPVPGQWQEGDAFNVTLNMTGGVQGETDVANITVVAPNNASYTIFGNLTTLADGNGSLTVDYPVGFPSGADTDFTGQYAILFNGTMATSSIFVGLTDLSQYHRDQTLDVKAVYAPGENVTLSIMGNNLNYTQSLSADNVTGIFHFVNSTILLNASASSVYTVNVTSVSGPTVKVPPDVQNFTVPGFAVNVTTRNLAGETVPNMFVEAFENLEPVSNGTSDANGLTILTLEVGSYVCNASFSGQEFGRITMVVNETSTVFDLPCNLTDLKVVVVDEDGVLIPDVQLDLVENQTSPISLNSTDVNGVSTLQSLLPILNNVPLTYSLNASRYGMLFNTTANFSLPIAPVVAWYNLTIICPKQNLNLNITDASGVPISGANVDATEVSGGLFYSNDTSTEGTATLRATFGRYLVQVYAGGIELNETTIDLNSTDVNATIVCGLYDLNVLVKLTDNFGQVISNLNVTIGWVGYSNSFSDVSGSNGIATFDGIVGGNLTFTVSPKGQSNQLAVATAYVSNSTTVEIRLDKYIVIAGTLVDLGQFATVLLIVLVVIFFICLELYLRRRSKSQSSGS
ncbi:MAG TPA: carboxypeptidase-like regulatory domain-containing protein [Candidatus Acidoferrum sp.]|nr:carboxypeptidase-like regulatory domain-containing protein [Candidatus Acidoferrum sp.]